MTMVSSVDDVFLPRFSVFRSLVAAFFVVVCVALPRLVCAAPPLRGAPVGVPLAHWSNDFSYGVRWSAPVRDLPREAFTHPHEVLSTNPDNGRGTRWHIRIHPGWSADAVIEIKASSTCIPGRTVCGFQGESLGVPVRIHVPARPLRRVRAMSP